MSEIIDDAKGRKIEVRQLVGRQLARLVRVAGASFGANVWSEGTLARATVVSIDGVPVPPRLETLDDLDGLWDAVDDEASLAAQKWVLDRSTHARDEAKNSLAPQDSETVSGS